MKTAVTYSNSMRGNQSEEAGLKGGVGQLKLLVSDCRSCKTTLVKYNNINNIKDCA